MLFGGVNPLDLVLSLPGILYALVVHEYAHAKVATALGDPTPRRAGRLTLDPLAHLDLLGTLAFLLLRFGWAKPVPIDPRHFAHPRRGVLLVAAAGPAANLALAFCLGVALTLLAAVPALSTPPLSYLATILQLALLLNIYLAVFNLLPIPPLDGANVLGALLPPAIARRFLALAQSGPLLAVLLVLFLFTSLPARALTPVVQAVAGAIQEASSAVGAAALNLVGVRLF